MWRLVALIAAALLVMAVFFTATYQGVFTPFNH